MTAYQHRHTKIVFTVGPACENEDQLRSIIDAGGDICRLNMAHTSHEWTRSMIHKVRKVASQLDRNVTIMMDIKGPEVRTGDIEGTWELQKDEIIHIVTEKTLLSNRPENIRAVTVNYPDIIHDVQKGNIILVDSGLIHLQIIDIQPQVIICKVIIPGLMKSRRHINLPGIKVNLPSLTQKDKEDIQLGLEENIRYYALSFVREAKDVDILRQHLSDNGSSAKIIAKIEDQCGLANMESIIKASDGLMVARGDLGVECPYEELPMIQTKMVKCCIQHSKPVIVATHMLESMITAPIPTRAEVNDIAKAVFEKADAIMLSGETSIGKYPAECVEVMKRVSKSIENIETLPTINDVTLETHRAKLIRSAVILSQELGNAPIIVFSTKGYLPMILSSLRPMHSPLFAFTNDPNVHQEMILYWGVRPFLIDFPEDPEARIQIALQKLLDKKMIASEQMLVVVTYIMAGNKRCDTVQIRQP